jgi:hypothetical protein
MDQDKHAEADQPGADRSHRLRVCSPEAAGGGLGLSEYQYYEFLAIDEALDARQMRELRALSTRARITPTGFVHTYHWGDFKGDPRVLMERYFDAFLYLVNWGTRLIMIRLPSSLLNLQMAGRYCRGASACAWQAGDKVVVELIQEGADDYWDEDDGTSLGLIVPARAELAAGDRRLLYLAWLLSVGAGEVADDELEPAVPVGLASLSPSLRTVSEFLHVDGDLLAAAAEASERPGTASLGAGECRPTRRDAASRRAKAPNPRCIFPAPTGDRDEGCPHRRCRTCPHRRCRTGLCLSVDLPPGPYGRSHRYP